MGTAKLTVDDQTHEFPIVEGSSGDRGIDIKKLRSEAGIITLDPGFTSTGSCQSGITFIDGDKGILTYRGYPIEQLAEKSDFVEVAWLLLYGDLPNATELQKLSLIHI